MPEEYRPYEADIAITDNPDDCFHWTGWKRRHWPADIIRPGLRLLAFDKKTGHFSAVVEVTRGGAFAYSTKTDFARKVEKATGIAPSRRDPHWDIVPEMKAGKPCTGIAFRWKILQEIEREWFGRFPQIGWLKLTEPPYVGPNDLGEVYLEANLQLHVRLERLRSKGARDAAWRYWKKQLGGVRCIACDFDFEKRYGEFGKGFIEMHHDQPLARSKGPRQVRPMDLKPLCSNCHRMIHKLAGRILTVRALRNMIRED